LADPQRVAIYGWSYGGYLAAMCLARAPETFTAAVAGAPVTHWDGYDTHYTERYMGTPQSNPDGYRESSVMAHVAGLRGDLLIVHGLIDENVHFRHTARLINALTAARKPYELIIFPDERHLPRSLADRVFMEERIVKFLMERLVERPR
jgi:dipeptidyl-peptidase-4